MEQPDFQARVIVPGNRIQEAESLLREGRKVVLGPGLSNNEDQIAAIKAGIVRLKKPHTFYVDCHQKRYVPARGETVVGVVIAKAGDFFRVDIGTSEPAILSYLAFENATKKNRPDVNIGDTIFAKLLIANRDLEPELICVDSHGKKGKLGVLSSDGFVFTVSIHLVRKILQESCPLLKALAKELAFETAIGMNGRIWIRGKTIKETIAVGNVILAAENMTNEEIVRNCDSIGRLLAGF